MKKIVALIITFTYINAFAATVDTVVIYSTAMHKDIKCVVIKPKSRSPLPVVYLLHGYSGNYSNWIMKVPILKKYADDFQLMIVCPDGDYSSWYVDSPIDSSKKYETYIAKEVPAYIDQHYATIKNRNARAITGLSMGGHGGLFLGFRHADFFGACGSMSGGVDLYATRSKFDITKRIGDTLHNGENWKEYSVIDVVAHYPRDTIAIIIDCGTEDFFYNNNRTLHEKMLKLKIKHDYIERPGQHNWEYWTNAVEYQLIFFRNFFKKSKLALDTGNRF